METSEVLAKCGICGKGGEDFSLFSTNHKDLGWIKVCRECWVRLYEDNRMVEGSGSSNRSPTSPCNSCPGRCF